MCFLSGWLNQHEYRVFLVPATYSVCGCAFGTERPLLVTLTKSAGPLYMDLASLTAIFLFRQVLQPLDLPATPTIS